MKLWRTREDSGVDPEQELRSLRPRPSDELVASVVADVRASRGPARFGRLGVALALTGLVVVSVMSFGGISYASGSAPRTSASAQYGPTSPPPPPPPSGGGKSGGQTPGGKTPGGKGTGGQGTGGKGGGVGGTSSGKPGSGLPFTGLTLWIPLAGGIALMILGVGLRWQGRRRPTSH